MRQIRDEQPELFERIKKLPKKARSGFRKERTADDQLITFFRLGKLKKFYQNRTGKSSEITFFDAVNLLECLPETARGKIPAEYYHLLETNKQRFHMDTTQDVEPDSKTGGRSNLNYIEKRLKDKFFKNCPTFTDHDEEFLDSIRKMIAQGTIAKKVSQKIKKEMERTMEPLEVLHILRKHIRTVPGAETKNSRSSLKREVILSGYLLGGQG